MLELDRCKRELINQSIKTSLSFKVVIGNIDGQTSDRASEKARGENSLNYGSANSSPPARQLLYILEYA